MFQRRLREMKAQPGYCLEHWGEFCGLVIRLQLVLDALELVWARDEKVAAARVGQEQPRRPASLVTGGARRGERQRTQRS
jgi:hypothetical protein